MRIGQELTQWHFFVLFKKQRFASRPKWGKGDRNLLERHFFVLLLFNKDFPTEAEKKESEACSS
jgi:hypothetical protein